MGDISRELSNELEMLDITIRAQVGSPLTIEEGKKYIHFKAKAMGDQTRKEYKQLTGRELVNRK